MKLTLQYKLFLLVLVPTLIIASLSTLMMRYLSERREVENLDYTMDIIAGQLGQRISSALDQAAIINDGSVQFVANSEFVTPDEVKGFLMKDLEKSDFILSSRIAFEPAYYKGQAHHFAVSRYNHSVYTGDLVSIIDHTDGSEYWYHTAKNSKKGIWESAVSDRESGLPVCRFSQPVYQKGKFIGVASVLIDLREFYDLVDTSYFSSMGFFLIDQVGKFIYYPEPKRILKENILKMERSRFNTVQLRELGQMMMRGETGKVTIEMAREENKRVLAYSHPVGRNGWSLCLFVDEKELLKGIEEREFSQIIVLSLSTITLILSLLWVARKITNPIKLMTSHIAGMSIRNPTEIPLYKSDDEIGVFINTFNKLVAASRDYQHTITEKDSLHQGALNAANDGIFDLRTRSKEINFSDRVFEIFGYQPGDFVPSIEQWESMIHPGERNEFSLALRSAIHGNTPFTLEHRIMKKNQSLAWVNVKALVYPLQDRQDEAWIIGVITDITPFKEAEQKLIIEKERLNAFIMASNTGAWELDISGKHLWCSNEYFSLLGRDAADYDLSAEGNLESVWIDLIHHQDRDTAVRVALAYVEQTDPGTYENSYRMYHKDGSERWMLARGSRLRNPDGTLSDFVLGTHIDITEQKRIEQRIVELNRNLEIKVNTRTAKLEEMLFEVNALNMKLRAREAALNASAIVSTSDISGKILDVNDAFCAISGYSREQLVGENHRILSSGTHDTHFWRGMYKTILAGKIWRDRICNKTASGTLFWTDTVIVPVMGVNNKPKEFFVMSFELKEKG